MEENKTLIDDGQIMDISIEEVEKLKEDDTIYYCTECNAFHIDPEKSWGDVNKQLDNL